MKRVLCSFFLVFLVGNGLLAQSQKYRLLFADVIYFDSGKSIVRPEFEKRLKAAADLLYKDAGAYAMIHAHTDSLGSYKDNEALASLRAQAVIAYMNTRHSIDTSRLKIRSLGEYSPLDDDGTEEGRAKNRCVTFYVMTPWDGSDYEVKSTIKGQLLDAKTGNPLIGRVLINHLNGKDTVTTDEDGYYETTVNLESYIEVRAYVKGYFFVSKVVKSRDAQTHVTNFNLERAIVGGKMLFNDLYFRSSTPLLLPSSEKALQGILTFLQENDDLKIEIGGHINKPNTPPVAENTDSYRLSESRAKTVYDYFIAKGIQKERLSYKGYGNWEMINPTADTEIEQQLNRRVELKVLE